MSSRAWTERNASNAQLKANYRAAIHGYCCCCRRRRCCYFYRSHYIPSRNFLFVLTHCCLCSPHSGSFYGASSAHTHLHEFVSAWAQFIGQSYFIFVQSSSIYTFSCAFFRLFCRCFFMAVDFVVCGIGAGARWPHFGVSYTHTNAASKSTRSQCDRWQSTIYSSILLHKYYDEMPPINTTA